MIKNWKSCGMMADNRRDRLVSTGARKCHSKKRSAFCLTETLWEVSGTELESADRKTDVFLPPITCLFLMPLFNILLLDSLLRYVV